MVTIVGPNVVDDHEMHFIIVYGAEDDSSQRHPIREYKSNSKRQTLRYSSTAKRRFEETRKTKKEKKSNRTQKRQETHQSPLGTTRQLASCHVRLLPVQAAASLGCSLSATRRFSTCFLFVFYSSCFLYLFIY